MQSTHPEATGVLAALSDELAGAAERAGRAVVAIHARRRIPASGVLWRPGVVVATHHTLEREEDLRVTLADGRSATAQLAGRDPATDLAVLRLEGDAAALPAAETADAGALRVGQLVLALGRPWEGGVTASLGVVSALAGEWRTGLGGRIDRLIRLDLSVRDGFSGGPLVDTQGRVLGINTSALARAAALTIPTATVERIAEQLLRSGRVARGFLGIATQPVRLPAALTQALGLTQEVGLLVVGVEPGGPAERAGLLLGDVLVSFAGTAVGEPAELAAQLGGERVGTAAELRLVRAGQVQALSVTIGERPRGRGR